MGDRAMLRWTVSSLLVAAGAFAATPSVGDETDHRLAGTLLAITGAGGGDLIRMRTDGSGRRVLARDVQSAAFSPDGRRIAFARSGDIYVMPAAGGSARRVVGGPYRSGNPTWSPDGTRLAYDSCTSGLLCDIFSARVDGAASIVKLTSGRSRPGDACEGEAFVGFSSPAWNPRGGTIAAAMSCWSEEDPMLLGAYVDASGKGVTRSFTARAFGSPDWAPDGARLAYRNRAGDAALDEAAVFTMRRDGSQNRRLTPLRSNTDTINNADGPTWSPDGTHLAYAKASSTTSGVPTQTWITDSTGRHRWLVATGVVPQDWAR
ncbi:MAG: hypothetical protein LCH77_16120 [Actinobacteria bacterium]|nr:hypothetical protein [Actinomycetota bacterium]